MSFFPLVSGLISISNSPQTRASRLFSLFPLFPVGGVCGLSIYKKHSHTLGKKEIRAQTQYWRGFETNGKKCKKGGKKGFLGKKG